MVLKLFPILSLANECGTGSLRLRLRVCIRMQYSHEGNPIVTLSYRQTRSIVRHLSKCPLHK
jgi:hypothetical protein